MGDVLSQIEIDSLLNALNSGEVDADELKKTGEKQIKEYDFTRPSKFSKDHLRTLEIIFEHYSRLLSTHLPAYLRKNIQVEVVNSEAIAFSEFTNALSHPVLLGIVDFNPLKGNIIIDLADDLGYTILDRMLGGRGEPLNAARDFSEIELTIIERVFNVFVNQLREPWANVVDLEPRLNRIETSSQFAQIIDPNEMISIVTLKLDIGKVDGMVNICLPYSCLENVIEKINTKFWYSKIQEKRQGEYKEVLESVISKTQVPIKSILGHSSITVKDFLELQTGDIIKLNTKVGNELDVYVGSLRKFKAYPGTSSKSYAVRISSIIREE